MHVTPYDHQLMFERKYSEVLLKKELREWLETAYKDELEQTAQVLGDWLAMPATYASKQDRLDLVRRDMDCLDMVVNAVLMVAMQDTGNGVTMQQAASQFINSFPGSWGMSIPDSIKTASEILARIGWEDLYTVEYGGGKEPVLLSDITLPREYEARLQLTGHPLPMLIPPMPLGHNRCTGYVSIPGSLVLGSKYNHHEGALCKEALEIQNNVAMSLNKDFLMVMDDIRPVFKTKEEEEQWDVLNKETKLIACELLQAGNRFWFTYRVDTRGRMYARGYQINPQGNSWRKAMLELANKEIVEIDP